jgi:hypothetical protein
MKLRLLEMEPEFFIKKDLKDYSAYNRIIVALFNLL